MIYHTKKGYTLIELMVVITIIGILVSIILGAFDAARSSARNNQRISDIQLLQIKLESYKSNFGVYPATLSQLVPNYIPAIPTDPTKHTQYDYVGTTIAGATACLGYHMRAQLEKNNAILLQDADENAAMPVCSGSGPSDFTGDDAQFYYDVVDPSSAMRSGSTINTTPVNNGGGNTGGGGTGGNGD